VSCPQSAVAEESKGQAKDRHQEGEAHQHCENVPPAAHIHITLPVCGAGAGNAGDQGGAVSSGREGAQQRHVQHRTATACKGVLGLDTTHNTDLLVQQAKMTKGAGGA
jgi:hypothetical protein